MNLATRIDTSRSRLWLPYENRRLSLPSDPLDRYRLLRDPWFFLANCVFTLDQAEQDSSRVIKPAPIDRPYLYTMTRLYQAKPLICVWKSRRMWISWLFISLFLHKAITGMGRNIFFVSKKEPDANDLVLKAKFIYDAIPRTLWPDDCLPKARYKENHLEFPETHSGIHAVASGPDQLRQFTASGIMMDEFGFWADAKDTYTAARPTIEGGGNVVILSSTPPKYGVDDPFFKKVIFDTID